jgi:hypothetical protein
MGYPVRHDSGILYQTAAGGRDKPIQMMDLELVRGQLDVFENLWARRQAWDKINMDFLSWRGIQNKLFLRFSAFFSVLLYTARTYASQIHVGQFKNIQITSA